MVRLSELKSTVQNSRPIKTVTTLPDNIITQREDTEGVAAEEEQEGDSGEQEMGGTEARPRRRKPARLLEATAKLEPEEKTRGKRQKDFDAAEQNESSDEENQKKERARAAEEPWTQNQQKLLELALQQYPKGSSDRWDKIARCVPSKSKLLVSAQIHLRWCSDKNTDGRRGSECPVESSPTRLGGLFSVICL
ncbi:DnaJ sub C member 1 [Saguinus oedipus]|uniref:DnaJ sub C member 1 n=1 Tax=Saguinus oedipus TaxID=9490 RepID=A0ABQ9V7P0_SAGOE|nr:DnaJ sub C member 1 [Saguinus oedipus]